MFASDSMPSQANSKTTPPAILALLVVLLLCGLVYFVVGRKASTFSDFRHETSHAISSGDFDTASQHALDGLESMNAKGSGNKSDDVAQGKEDLSCLAFAREDVPLAMKYLDELIEYHEDVGNDSRRSKHERVRLSAIRNVYHSLQGEEAETISQLAEAKRMELQGRLDYFHERPYEAMEKLDAAAVIYDTELGDGNLLSSLLNPLLIDLKLNHGGIENNLEVISNAENALSGHLGKHHPVTLSMSLAFGTCLKISGDASAAVSFYSELIDRAKDSLDPDHSIVIDAMIKLGYSQSRNGEFGDAQRTFDETEKLIRGRASNVDWELARLDQERLDLLIGEGFLKRGIALGESKIDHLDSLNGADQRDWRLPSHESRQRLIARYKQLTATCLLYQPSEQENQQAQRDRSLRYLHECQNTFKRLGLTRTRRYIWILNDLATQSCWDAKDADWEAARNYCSESVELYESMERHGSRRFMPTLLRTLGNAEFGAGNLEAAIECFKRAIENCPDSSMGEASRAMNLRDLGVTYHKTGQSKLAADSIIESIQIYEDMFKPSLLEHVGDDARPLTKNLRITLRDLVGVIDQADSDEVVRAFNMVSRIKGVLTRSVSTRSRMLRDPEVESVHEEYREVVQKISARYLGPHDESELESLVEKKKRLTYEIGSRLAETDSQFIPESAVEQLRDLLPNNTALIEFYWQKKTAKFLRERNFFAFVVAKSDDEFSVSVVPLGLSKDLDELVEKAFPSTASEVADAGPELAANLRGTGVPTAMDVDLQARAMLKELVWDKLKTKFGNCKTILACGDGSLERVAWSALPGDSAGKFLMDELLLPSFSNSREVIDVLTAAPVAEKGAMVVGGVEYGTPVENGPEYVALPASIDEMESLLSKPLPRPVNVLKGDSVSEEAVSARLQNSNFAFIATHGVVVQNSGENPFSKCALVLSNANTLFEEDFDGMLSGEEINLLDLRNLDFVVLSTCSSAAGEQLSGEGIITLQKSMMLAGARSCLASSWSVKDADANAFMGFFFDNFFEKKMTKIESLHAAQQQMVAAGFSSESWANWRITGDWR